MRTIFVSLSECAPNENYQFGCVWRFTGNKLTTTYGHKNEQIYNGVKGAPETQANALTTTSVWPSNEHINNKSHGSGQQTASGRRSSAPLSAAEKATPWNVQLVANRDAPRNPLSVTEPASEQINNNLGRPVPVAQNHRIVNNRRIMLIRFGSYVAL